MVTHRFTAVQNAHVKMYKATVAYGHGHTVRNLNGSKSRKPESDERLPHVLDAAVNEWTPAITD